MKRSRVVLFLPPAIAGLLVIAASCGEATDKKALKAGTGRYYQPKDGGDGSTSSSTSTSLEAGIPDAPEFEMPRELKGPAQALQVLITSYDLELKEADYGKSTGKTPVMQAYCSDLIQDVKASRARVKALAAAKNVTPTRSNMTERMKFESQAAMSHLDNIFRNMFLDAYMSRRIDTANNLMRVVESELAPILTDDDYKQELATTMTELEKRVARAEAVKSGLDNGPTSSEGMFEEIEGPVPSAVQPQSPQQAPQQTPQQPAEKPPTEVPADDGGA